MPHDDTLLLESPNVLYNIYIILRPLHKNKKLGWRMAGQVSRANGKREGQVRGSNPRPTDGRSLYDFSSYYSDLTYGRVLYVAQVSEVLLALVMEIHGSTCY
jgi:hypothetical protein